MANDQATYIPFQVYTTGASYDLLVYSYFSMMM